MEAQRQWLFISELLLQQTLNGLKVHAELSMKVIYGHNVQDEQKNVNTIKTGGKIKKQNKIQ